MPLNMFTLTSMLLAGVIVLAALIYKHEAQKQVSTSPMKAKGGEIMPIGDPAEKYNQDGSISQQWLAEEITRREEKLEEVDIAQTKEILRVVLDILNELQEDEPDKFDELLAKH